MSSTESDFLMAMENKEQYKGQWIAILDSRVIAQGQNISKVYHDAIKQSNGRTPLFEQIPENLKKQTLIL